MQLVHHLRGRCLSILLRLCCFFLRLRNGRFIPIDRAQRFPDLDLYFAGTRVIQFGTREMIHKIDLVAVCDHPLPMQHTQNIHSRSISYKC